MALVDVEELVRIKQHVTQVRESFPGDLVGRQLGRGVLGGVVVSFSWWGVNLLNVGLHSYGFTSGVALILYTAWGIEALVLLLSGIDAFLGRSREPAPRAAELPPVVEGAA